MLVRSFYSKHHRHYAHLVICPETRLAAMIDPLSSDVGEYAGAADRDGARITLGLQTAARPTDRDGLNALHATCGADTYAPQADHLQSAGTRIVRVGDLIEFAGQTIHVVANTPPAGPDVAYRIAGTLFTGWTLVRGQTNGEALPSDTNEIISRARSDLDSLLDARKLTNKETQLAISYLECFDQLGRPPSATELADRTAGIDRGGVHVLIHGIRRKQVALGQVPILLDGQMHKWLRGLQGEPDFTRHEQTFLSAYLAFVDEQGRVPSGPELLDRLPSGTVIQWVRKRVHTIRKKQAAFGKPPLRMSREHRPAP